MSYKVQLPDIEEMFSMIDKITETSYERSLLDLEIKFTESEITKKASIDPTYYQNGKPPSMAYIDATWKFTGFNNELVQKRQQLVKLSSKLDELKLKFQLYKEIIDLYRTQSANERVQVV